jgi:beta-carotene hydroxylase
MKLRFLADRRTLLWAFGLFPGVALAPYAAPHLAGWLVPLSLYTGFCSGVLAHNQNHCPTFERRGMNSFYAAWLSVFYGFPMFAWIPTHNLNHHKFLNRAGDATITWRHSKNNTWLVASTYFFVSAYWQSAPIKAFVRKARATNPRVFRQIVVQRLTVVCVHASLLALAVALHGWKKGAIVYALGFGVSAAMASGE